MSHYVLGMRVDATSNEGAAAQVAAWAREGRPRYVCVANVHMTMEAFDAPAFRRIVNGADLVTPDGMPLVWVLRLLGAAKQQRVYGPDLVLHVCASAEKEGVPVGLYGGTPDSLARFVDFLRVRFPNLQIAARISPPFRSLTPAEDEAYTQQLVDSGARIILVGIGCPKQERWMAEHRERIPSVMIGVGAAFDFHSGRVAQAPKWMQRSGLEWLFRLLVEPRRLWKRYLIHNPRFLFHLVLQLLGLASYKEA